MEEFKKFELLTNRIYCQVLNDDYKYEFNYYLLKKSKSFFIKKVIRKVLVILKLKKNE